MDTLQPRFRHLCTESYATVEIKQSAAVRKSQFSAFSDMIDLFLFLKGGGIIKGALKLFLSCWLSGHVFQATFSSFIIIFISKI